MIMAKENTTLPGDKVASTEEFEPADGTYESNGVVRSSRIGKTVFDLKKRTVKIDHKAKSALLPKVGDLVVGFVNMVPGNMVSMKILYINDAKSDANFEAISLMKGGRGRRGVMFRMGDVVRAKVVSLLNANIHVTFHDSNLGVLYTACHSCGNNVVKVDGMVKCIECGATEERKFAEDYGKVNLILSHYQGS
jgi:exosome complex component CSL4